MKPIKGLDGPEQPRETGKVAQAIGAGALKLVEWLTLGVMFAGMCAVVAFTVMVSLGWMHGEAPTVPAPSFFFIWSAIWGSSVLALWAGALVKMATKDDE